MKRSGKEKVLFPAESGFRTGCDHLGSFWHQGKTIGLQKRKKKKINFWKSSLGGSLKTFLLWESTGEFRAPHCRWQRLFYTLVYYWVQTPGIFSPIWLIVLCCRNMELVEMLSFNSLLLSLKVQQHKSHLIWFAVIYFHIKKLAFLKKKNVTTITFHARVLDENHLSFNYFLKSSIKMCPLV